MGNTSGNAYGLTILSPLKPVDSENKSVVLKLRSTLLNLNSLKISPMSKVPNTYLARFYILEDVFFQDYPNTLEHLKSKYLVFTSNFYGSLDTYLDGMFYAIPNEIKSIWQDCYGFNADAMHAQGFKEYIKKCQVETTFFFNGSIDDSNGSTDVSLEEQLKSLYIKQEFSKFVFENSHRKPEELLESFKVFAEDSRPGEMFPKWKAGWHKLKGIVDRGENV